MKTATAARRDRTSTHRKQEVLGMGRVGVLLRGVSIPRHHPVQRHRLLSNSVDIVFIFYFFVDYNGRFWGNNSRHDQLHMVMSGHLSLFFFFSSVNIGYHIHEVSEAYGSVHIY